MFQSAAWIHTLAGEILRYSIGPTFTRELGIQLNQRLRISLINTDWTEMANKTYRKRKGTSYPLAFNEGFMSNGEYELTARKAGMIFH